MLPIDAVRHQLKNILKESNTAIFIGETGSGKSTQIPQICVEAGLCRNKILAVTQPRKVAARALAYRVAEEMKCSVGKTVGYKFRFEDNVSDKTKIAYLTDGILLREALHDCFLSKYSVVIVDEAHERSVHTDILLFVLKLAQKQRENSNLGSLKIFLMSATIQSEKFSNYFDNAMVYYIRGRTHAVELFCADELSVKNDDYLYNSVTTVLQLHKTESLENGFLVFLTGQEEIEAACKMVEKYSKDFKNKITAIPLYSSVNLTIQQLAFAPSPLNSRKVIFSTNIAETSVTIPGISIVIDSGKVKQKFFSSKSVDILEVVNISKAQAIQRAGRSGREKKGKCYRLYSQEDYNNFLDIQQPEILRTNLSSVILNLVKMGLKKIKNLKLIDQPDVELLKAAILELRYLGAIEKDSKERLKVTDLGIEIVKFPINPSHAKILLSAKSLGCLDEALSIVAFLSSENVFLSSNYNVILQNEDKKENISNNHCTIFDANEGDHIRMLKIYRNFKTQLRNNKNNLREWCVTNGLHQGRLENVVKIRKQLDEICRDNSYEKSSCGSDFILLRKAICQGLFLNACILDRATSKYSLQRDKNINVKIHPSSCLARSFVSAFVYSDLVHTRETYARDICLADLNWISETWENFKKLK